MDSVLLLFMQSFSLFIINYTWYFFLCLSSLYFILLNNQFYVFTFFYLAYETISK